MRQAPLKKLLAISLLLMVFFNHVAYYFVYSVQQHYIKKQVKRELRASLPLETLDRIVDSDKLRWEEENKEFYYEGDLYDVVTMKIENGKKILYCIQDEKETKLLKAFARTARSRADSRGKGKKSSYPHLSFDCTLDNKEERPNLNNESSLDKAFLATALLTSTIEVKGPPPKT